MAASAAAAQREARAAERDALDASESGDLRKLREAMRVLAESSSSSEGQREGATRAVANRAHPATGLAPLHTAAARGHLHIVEALVTDFSADPSRVASGSSLLEQPVHFAARNGHLACVSFFVAGKHATVEESTRDWPLLHVAAVNGHAHVVRWLLSNGADPHRRGVMGRTALTRAAFCKGAGGVDTVRALLESGANPDARDDAGDYPCLVAAREGNAETLDVLLASGADVSGRAFFFHIDDDDDDDDDDAVEESREEARSLLRAAAAAEDRTGRALEVLLRHFADVAAAANRGARFETLQKHRHHHHHHHHLHRHDDYPNHPPKHHPKPTTWLFYHNPSREQVLHERTSNDDEELVTGTTTVATMTTTTTLRYRSRECVDGGDEGTALHVAAKFGNLEAVEILVRAVAAARSGIYHSRSIASSSSSLSTVGVGAGAGAGAGPSRLSAGTEGSEASRYIAMLDKHSRTAADVAADDACCIVASGKRWSPSAHHRYPRAFRVAVKTFLMCLHVRQRRQQRVVDVDVDGEEEEDAASSSSSSSSSIVPLPSLPQVILHEVMHLIATPLSPWRNATVMAEEEEAAARRQRQSSFGGETDWGWDGLYGKAHRGKEDDERSTGMMAGDDGGVGGNGSLAATRIDVFMPNGELDMDALGACLPRR